MPPFTSDAAAIEAVAIFGLFSNELRQYPKPIWMFVAKLVLYDFETDQR